jgi:CHAT domain-containing protein/tetratricopeptide (TPR) repeat protein
MRTLSNKSPCVLILALALCVCAEAFAGEAEWAAHMNAGEIANRAGDYRTAAGRYEAALREAESFGASDPRLAKTLNDLAASYTRQERFAEAEPLYRRSLAIREKVLGPEHPDVGQSLNNLATLYRARGRFAEAEPLYRRSLEIRERALGSDHPDVGASSNGLGGLYEMQGRYAEAEPLFLRALVIREKALGPDHAAVGGSLNNLAGLYQAQGRFAEAEPLYRRALGIWEKTLGPDHPDLGALLNNFALLYREQGRFSDAELLHRRSLAIWEKTLGSDHSQVGMSLTNIANLYQRQGRFAEAEPLYHRALEIREKALGSDHPEVGESLNGLAGLYQEQGRFAEAEPLHRRVLGIWEKALGPDHATVGASLNNLASLYQAQGRYAEAEPLYRRALGIWEKALGPEHPDVGEPLNGVAGLYRAQGRFAEAEPLYRRALGIWEKALGPDHPKVGQSLNDLAQLYRSQGKLDESLALARRATGLLASRFATDRGGSRPGMLAEQRKYSDAFQLHVALLAAVVDRAPEVSAEAAGESFRVAQLARASDTAEQVGKMAARYAAGSDALAELARQRQDALARFDQLDTRILQAAGQRGNESLAASLRAEQAGTAAAIAKLDVRLERDYPQYRELINPKPLELAAAQQLLADDEALLLFLVTYDESYLWALRRGDSGFFKLALKRSELAEAVKKLRTQLDLGIDNPVAMLKKPFDVAAAHTLYRTILGPAHALLMGATQLIVVPDGALQSLPPGVLVTELPAKPVGATAEHAKVAWLAKKYAITVLPAAASLRALRQFAKAPSSREPFAGFGDPVLAGSGEGTRRMNVAALYSRGAVADVNEVRKLPRLAETADELRAIAAQLKAPATAIRLGAAATERAVKEADLARYRNLAFATHGLMAGDFKGLAEPALVLTPPAQGSELDDGLLTAGEIAQLKLDADWVVLSACNTAAPDGTPGAEGLSGLARAFFYAGARSLLVSHWAVSSEAAKALTTRMFDQSAKGASKAEALRRSMLALMARTDKWYFAHPALWAPFVVVGEGNAEWAVRR